jgi:hypothetical protein
MAEKKLQIFVSSTFSDLRDERQAAVEAILTAGHIPAGMELFAAGDETQWTVIQRWIDDSDIYMLILGGRYGSVDTKTGKSYTQMEYEYAVSQNKPLFALVLSEKAIDDKVDRQGKDVLELERGGELRKFKEQVMGRMVSICDDLKDIKIKIPIALRDIADRRDLIGWVRGDQAYNSGLVAEEMARLTKENEELKQTVEKSDNSEPAIFSGLTYSQLKHLLQKEVNDADAKDANLHEFLIRRGEALLKGTQFASNPELVRRMERLKVYKLIDHYRNRLGFMFSELGHKYYLRSQVDK